MHDQPDMLGIPDDAASLVGKDLADVPESKWAPMLANTLAVLESLYRRRGMDESTAFLLARDSTMELAEYLGGRVNYFPRGDRLKLALRDAEIFRRARRGNIQQLADEYDVTDIQIYRIIRDQHRLHISKVQRPLFEE